MKLLLILIWLATSVSLNTSESRQPNNHLRGRLYVKTQGETQEEKSEYHRKDVPHENETSPDSESLLPTARRRDRQWKREHHSSQGGQARGLAHTFRANVARICYHSAYTGTQTKGAMYQTAYRSVSHGVCL
jgi:hypothetical protein